MDHRADALLLSLSKQWSAPKVAGRINDELLDKIIQDPSLLSKDQKLRLLYAFLKLRKEQVRAFKWKIQKITSTLAEEDEKEPSFVSFLGGVVLETFGDESDTVQQEAKKIFGTLLNPSEDLSSVACYNRRTVPLEMGLLRGSLRPASLEESVGSSRGFRVTKNVTFDEDFRNSEDTDAAL
mmetsp:Transcript_10749/g.16016  ORF Transcript_10749/g.16016 Transcript_10749/m.16016 type:complete len:181 (-) Transcript_10749:180-722(-)|eukprot:CAMPEP_0167757842 /NCGR_PEP_ID=MMETSP0110_2-20121227/10146_1 /TAXON_ID=629695 /ORGANISM="Gymnochlora sp., Strain CCMP2014" /LENGTH=180 /DNA_ID=CAMNT_0007644069 /DNA_START=32 /DNA_END=574 /DNA_ORIENTATION=+